MPKSYMCEYCGRCYRLNEALTKHILKAHSPSKRNAVKFKCEYCNKEFSHKRNIHYHIRSIHGMDTSTKPTNRLKCALCQDFVLNKSMHGHLTIEHQIEIKTEDIKFSSFSKFIVWKEKVENETKSRFVKSYHPKKLKDSSVRHYFNCSRSGFYTPKGNGKRRLKTQGSVKINAYCPAKIVVDELNNGTCIVNFTQTHVGHGTDLHHLYLTSTEREILARKIQMKIPLQVILDEVHDSISESKLERIHILTRKDLLNISQSIKLNKNAVGHSNDDTGDEMWIDESSDGEKNCIETIEILQVNTFEEHSPSLDLSTRKNDLK